MWAYDRRFVVALKNGIELSLIPSTSSEYLEMVVCAGDVPIPERISELRFMGEYQLTWKELRELVTEFGEQKNPTLVHFALKAHERTGIPL
jgi:hypothetical protein